MEKKYDEEEIYDKIISTGGEKLKNNGMIEDANKDNNKIKLKNPKNFELGDNVPEAPAKEENKYIIGRKSFEDGEYFVIVRNSGESLGKVESSSELTKTNPTIPIDSLSKRNSCIGYLLKGKNTGFFNGSERLLKKFVEQDYRKSARISQKFITLEKFLEELKQIPTPYNIEIELSNFAEPFVYVDYEQKHLIVNDNHHKLDEFLKTFNILLIKSLTLEDKDISYNKEILRIKFSVGKLSDSDGNSNLKIDPQFIRKGTKFENFYKNIKGYTHIQLNVSKRDKIEYLLVKRKIIKNLLNDEDFIKEIKNIGIISEDSILKDSKWIKYSIDLDKITKTIKQNLPQGATLDDKPLNLDTKSFLFYNKKEIRGNYIKEGCIFKIKQDNGQHVNLLLLNKYEFKEFKKGLEVPIKELNTHDADKLAIIARSSYLYPFIVVDLNGAHIKYHNTTEEVGSAPITPFLPRAPDFLSDIKGSLKMALANYEIEEKEYKDDLAVILYKFFEKYNNNKIMDIKDKKRIGTYMERVFYALIVTFEGKTEKLGGKNEPDALIKYENKDRKVLYLFDTKNLKGSSLNENIREKAKKSNYTFTFERYVNDYTASWNKIFFIYVVNKEKENEIPKVTEAINERIVQLQKYKEKVEVKIMSLDEVYKRAHEKRTIDIFRN